MIKGDTPTPISTKKIKTKKKKKKRKKKSEKKTPPQKEPPGRPPNYQQKKKKKKKKKKTKKTTKNLKKSADRLINPKTLSCFAQDVREKQYQIRKQKSDINAPTARESPGGPPDVDPKQ